MATKFNAQLAMLVVALAIVGYSLLSPQGYATSDLKITPASTYCQDSDNGFNTAQAGTCTDSISAYTDVCHPSGRSLTEYYCTSVGQRCAPKPQQCGSNERCVSGACVAA